MLAFRYDRRSGVPAYVQLTTQVRQALRRGELQLGDRLPTAKEVVTALAINPNTVLKAYRELEREGLAEGRPGQGTFIIATLEKPEMSQLDHLRTEATGWVSQARAAGLDRNDIEAIITAILDASERES